MRILMVCLGNICRSPLAEGVLRKKIHENNLNWIVDSAGTSAYHIGQKPDSRSIEIAKTNGIDISNLAARQFSKDDYSNFDLILAMDSSNFSNIAALAQNDIEKRKLKLILNYLNPGMNGAVPDPYYNGNFEQVFELLNSACDKLIDDIVPKK